MEEFGYPGSCAFFVLSPGLHLESLSQALESSVEADCILSPSPDCSNLALSPPDLRGEEEEEVVVGLFTVWSLIKDGGKCAQELESSTRAS